MQVDGVCSTVPGNGPHPVTICQSGSYVTGIVDQAQGATAQVQGSSLFSKNYSPSPSPSPSLDPSLDPIYSHCPLPTDPDPNLHPKQAA
eukprot:scaffold61942_cov66-Phaeocystis_antarctica.AAC.1